jgi:hypothetical protein
MISSVIACFFTIEQQLNDFILLAFDSLNQKHSLDKLFLLLKMNIISLSLVGERQPFRNKTPSKQFNYCQA